MRGWENSFDGKTLSFPGRRVSAEISQTSEITGARLVHAQNNYQASEPGPAAEQTGSTGRHRSFNGRPDNNTPYENAFE